MNTVCRLEEFGLLRLHLDYSAKEGLPVRGQTTDWHFATQVGRHQEKDRLFRVQFAVKFQEHTADKGEHGFSGEAIIIGIVTISDEIPADKTGAMAHVHGVNILYGTLRGLIASATGTFPGGPLTIPSFSANDILKRTQGAPTVTEGITVPGQLAAGPPKPVPPPARRKTHKGGK